MVRIAKFSFQVPNQGANQLTPYDSASPDSLLSPHSGNFGSGSCQLKSPLAKGIVLLKCQEGDLSQDHSAKVAQVIAHMVKEKSLIGVSRPIRLRFEKIEEGSSHAVVKIDDRRLCFKVDTEAPTPQECRIKELADVHLHFPKVWTRLEKSAWITLLFIPIVGWLVAYFWNRFNWGSPNPIDFLNGRFEQRGPEDLVKHLNLMTKLIEGEMGHIKGADQLKARQSALHALKEAASWTDRIAQAARKQPGKELSQLAKEASRMVLSSWDGAVDGQVLLTLPMGYYSEDRFQPVWVSLTRREGELQLEMIHSDPNCALAGAAMSRFALKKRDLNSLSTSIEGLLQFSIPPSQASDRSKRMGARIQSAFQFILKQKTMDKPKAGNLDATPPWKMMQAALTASSPQALQVPAAFARPLEMERDWEESIWKWLQGVEPSLSREDRLQWKGEFASNYAHYMLEMLGRKKVVSTSHLDQLSRLHAYIRDLKAEYESWHGKESFGYVHGSWGEDKLFSKLDRISAQLSAQILSKATKEMGKNPAKPVWHTTLSAQESFEVADIERHAAFLSEIQANRQLLEGCANSPDKVEGAIKVLQTQVEKLAQPQITDEARLHLCSEWIGAIPIDASFEKGCWRGMSIQNALAMSRLINQVMKQMFEAQMRTQRPHAWSQDVRACSKAQVLTWICARQAGMEVAKKLLSHLISSQAAPTTDIETKLVSLSKYLEKPESFAKEFHRLFKACNSSTIHLPDFSKMGLKADEIALLVCSLCRPDGFKIGSILHNHPLFQLGGDFQHEKELMAMQHLLPNPIAEVSCQGVKQASKGVIIDTLDCAADTSVAEHGMLYFSAMARAQEGAINSSAGKKERQQATEMFEAAVNGQAKTCGGLVCPQAISDRVRVDFYAQVILHPESALFRGFSGKLEQIKWTKELFTKAAQTTSQLSDQMVEAGRLHVEEIRQTVSQAKGFRLQAGRTSYSNDPCITVDLGKGLAPLEYCPWGVSFFDYRDPWHDWAAVSADGKEKEYLQSIVGTCDIPKTMGYSKISEPNAFQMHTEVTTWYLQALHSNEPQLAAELKNMALRVSNLSSAFSENITPDSNWSGFKWATTNIQNVLLFALKHPDRLDEPFIQQIMLQNYFRLNLLTEALISEPQALSALLTQLAVNNELLRANPHTLEASAFITQLLQASLIRLESLKADENASPHLSLSLRQALAEDVHQCKEQLALKLKSIEELDLKKRLASMYLQLARTQMAGTQLAGSSPEWAQSYDVNTSQGLENWIQILKMARVVLNTPHAVGSPDTARQLRLWAKTDLVRALHALSQVDRSAILNQLVPKASVAYEGNWSFQGDVWSSGDGKYQFDWHSLDLKIQAQPPLDMELPESISNHPDCQQVFGSCRPLARVYREQGHWVYRLNYETAAYEIHVNDEGSSVRLFQKVGKHRLEFIHPKGAHALIDRYGVWTSDLSDAGSKGNQPYAFIQVNAPGVPSDRSRLQVQLVKNESGYGIESLNVQGLSVASSPRQLLGEKFNFACDDNTLALFNEGGLQELYFLDHGVYLKKTEVGGWQAGPPYSNYELLDDPEMWQKLLQQMGSIDPRQCLPLVRKKGHLEQIQLLFQPPPRHGGAVQPGALAHSQEVKDRALGDKAPSLISVICEPSFKGDDFAIHTGVNGYFYLAYQAAVINDYERAALYLDQAHQSHISLSDKSSLEQIAVLFNQWPCDNLPSLTLQIKARLLLESVEKDRWAQVKFDPERWRSYYDELQELMGLYRRYQAMQLQSQEKGDPVVALSTEELIHLDEYSSMGMEFLIEHSTPEVVLAAPSLPTPKPELTRASFKRFCAELTNYLQPAYKTNRIESLEMNPSKQRFLTFFWGMLKQIEEQKLKEDHSLIAKLRCLSLDHLSEEDRAQVEMARSLLLNASKKAGAFSLYVDNKYFKALQVHQDRISSDSFGGYIDMIYYYFYGKNIAQAKVVLKEQLLPLFESYEAPAQVALQELDGGVQTSLSKIQECLQGDKLSKAEKAPMKAMLEQIKGKTQQEKIPLLSLLESLVTARVQALALRREAEVQKVIDKLEAAGKSSSSKVLTLPPIALSSLTIKAAGEQEVWLEGIKTRFFQKASHEEKPSLECVKKALSMEVSDPMQQAEHAHLHAGIDAADGAGFFSEGQMQLKSSASLSQLAGQLELRRDAMEGAALEIKRHLLSAMRKRAKSLGLSELFDKESLLTPSGVWEKILDRYQRKGFKIEGQDSSPSLDSQLTQFLYLATCSQQMERARALVESHQVDWSHLDLLTRKQIAGQVMNTLSNGSDLRRYSVNKLGTWQLDPSSVARKHLLAEYRHCLIAHADQCHVVETMLEKPDSIMLLRMGAGKSSWIAPELAYLLSERGKFPVVLVTDELLQMNRNSLDKHTREVFGQASHVLNFSRKTPMDTTHLMEEYRRLLQAKQSGGYVVTSISQLASIDNSLILKKSELSSSYMKLCKALTPFNLKDEKCAQALQELVDLQQQIHYLSKLRELLHATNTQYVADEVDAIFNPDNEYNFSCGVKEPLNPHLSTLMAGLFQGMKQGTPGSALAKLFQALLSNDQYLLNRADAIDPAMKELASWLWNESDPLKIGEDWKRLKAEITAESFVEFITQSSKGSLPSIDRLNKSQIEQLKRLQKVFNGVLPHALGLRAQVDYGLSSQDGVAVVPYNNCQETPGTRYSDPEEIAVYHFLYYLSKGPSAAYFEQQFKKQFVEPDEQWSGWMRKQGPAPTGVKNQKHLYQQALLPTALGAEHRLHLLESVFADHTRLWSQQIRCNAQDILRDAHVGGISGTINEAALPDSFIRDESVFSSKVAADTLQLLAYEYRDKKGLQTPLTQFEDDATLLIEQAMKPNVNAIINQGAALESLATNEIVALLRSQLKEKGNPRQVAFVDDITGRQMIWEEGEGKLPKPFDVGLCRPNCLFYYGPKDYRGVDFPIPSGSHSAFIAGADANMSTWLQSLWRLRGLATRHHCELFMSKKAAKAVTSDLKLTEELTLLDLYRAIEKRTLLQQGMKNFKAMSHEMETSLQCAVRQSLLAPRYEKTPEPVDPMNSASVLVFLKNIAMEANLMAIPGVKELFIHERKASDDSSLSEVEYQSPQQVLIGQLARQKQKVQELSLQLDAHQWVLPPSFVSIAPMLGLDSDGQLLSLKKLLQLDLPKQLDKRQADLELQWDNRYAYRFETQVKNSLSQVGSVELAQEQQQQQVSVSGGEVDLSAAKELHKKRKWKLWSFSSIFSDKAIDHAPEPFSSSMGLGSVSMSVNYKSLFQAQKSTFSCKGRLPNRVLLIQKMGKSQVILLDEVDYEKIVKKRLNEGEASSWGVSMALVSEAPSGFLKLKSAGPFIESEAALLALNLAKVALGAVEFAAEDSAIMKQWVQSLTEAQYTELCAHIAKTRQLSLVTQVPGWQMSPLKR